MVHRKYECLCRMTFQTNISLMDGIGQDYALHFSIFAKHVLVTGYGDMFSCTSVLMIYATKIALWCGMTAEHVTCYNHESH